MPFAASSPWRLTLPDAAPLDADSAAIDANILSQIQNAWGHAALNTSSYSSPIYTVGAAQPTVNVTWSNCQHKSRSNPAVMASLQNVPIPAGAVASLGTDAEMVIWQPSTDTEWEFWKIGQSGGAWSACSGAMTQQVSQSPGIFANGLGVTGSGLPLLGFLIRVSDLQSGAINHAINLELPSTRASTISWPATRTDGSASGSTYPVEGQRFRLPASLDLSQLHLSAGELMIARAMQRYGLIVTDKSGAVAIQAEDPRPYMTAGQANPYTPYFAGTQQSSWLKDLPWQDLQALPLDYGAPTAG